MTDDRIGILAQSLSCEDLKSEAMAAVQEANERRQTAAAFLAAVAVRQLREIYGPGHTAMFQVELGDRVAECWIFDIKGLGGEPRETLRQQCGGGWFIEDAEDVLGELFEMLGRDLDPPGIFQALNRARDRFTFQF